MSEAAVAGAGGLSMSEHEFEDLRDFLYQCSGLYFSEPKKFLLENRVFKRVRAVGASTVAQYLETVRSPTRGVAELRELLDVVTTHETSFFRNQPQLEAFRRRVATEVLEHQRAAGRNTLRIWSAACSSGEEPYTLAMLLLELLGDEAKRWRIRILGTDIARSVLEKAREGLYSRYSFRTTPAYFINKYFTFEGTDQLRISDEVKRLVDYQVLNFADDTRMRVMRGFHVIFCRNALIYFDQAAKRRFVKHFARALEDQGYFFVGHSESLHGVSDEFRLIHFPGALAYQKPGTETTGA